MVLEDSTLRVIIFLVRALVKICKLWDELARCHFNAGMRCLLHSSWNVAYRWGEVCELMIGHKQDRACMCTDLINEYKAINIDQLDMMS